MAGDDDSYCRTEVRELRLAARAEIPSQDRFSTHVGCENFCPTVSPADVAARLAELEAAVASLRETVDHQHEIIAILSAAIDSNALPEMTCPCCTDRTLTRDHGLTCGRVQCTSCDFSGHL
jgi:hypothetical protein